MTKKRVSDQQRKLSNIVFLVHFSCLSIATIMTISDRVRERERDQQMKTTVRYKAS